MTEPIYSYVRGKGWVIGPSGPLTVKASELKVGDLINKAYYRSGALCSWPVYRICDYGTYNLGFWQRNYPDFTFEVTRD